MKQFIYIFALFLPATNLSAAVFQYAIPIATRKGDRTAYLWIPPQAKQVRGVVMGGMTLMEREFAQDVRIRKACAEQQLAIMFLKCGLGAADIQEVLGRFAKISGYRELSVAPLMFVGHSAGGPQARRRACEFGNRCFGLIQYRGADPGDVDHEGKEGLPPGIPAVMMIGQFDEFGKIGRDENGVENWEKDRDKLAKFRAANERNLGNILVEPGAGHFAWSDRNAEFLALFIPRAARARIPAAWPSNSEKPIALKLIDPNSGWLTGLDLKSVAYASSLRNSAGKLEAYPTDPYEKYQGDKKHTAWHFDKTLAEATVAYHAGLGKEDQFIKWNDPHHVSAGARNFFDEIHWVGDGQTFKVHPAYASSYPQQIKGRGSRWGKAGQTVGRASTSIRVKPVSGPIVAAGKSTFQVRYNELAPATENARVTFMAFSNGGERYRYTERVGMISRLALTTGKPQTIAFSPIGDLKVGDDPIELKATSDAKLPVQYYVAFGPAKIVDGKLVVSDLPAREKFPIAVKVVAYQFGCGVEPLVQTAQPVEQTIQIQQ